MSYKVDLKNFMARCESNYRRLHQVFPDMAVDQERCLGLTTVDNREVVLTVLERTPYTTLLAVEEKLKNAANPTTNTDWFKPLLLTVRIYHDAKLAEVVSCDGMRNAKPKNEYPNKNMLQRDEKAQWNRFLEEWLVVCIEYGYVSESGLVLLNGGVE